MFFGKFLVAAIAVCSLLCLGTRPSLAEHTDTGYQTIDGTRVHTTIYYERGYAVFENDCGSQRISQSALQAGAKPTDIIPCPRPSSRPNSNTTTTAPDEPYTGKRLWAAVAAGIDQGLLTSYVSAGFGKDYATRADAEAGALRSCQKNFTGTCKVVTAWNAGCYYITVSKNASPVAWGSGPTSQDAYNECYKRIKSGNCDTQTLGGCYPK